MTPTQLQEIGEALYGSEHWKPQLAKDLCVSARAVQRYADGSRRIADTLAPIMLKLVKERRKTLAQASRRLKEII